MAGMAGTLPSGSSRLRVCLGHLDGGSDQHQQPQLGSRRRAGGSGAGSAAGGSAVTPCSTSALGGIVCGCAGGLVGFGLAYWQQKRALGSGSEVVPPPQPSAALANLGGIPDSDEDDWRFLQLAFDAKEARRPPDHSGFRVTAVIVYTDEEGRRRHVIGHNAEVAQPALTGAICAERDAMTTALGSHHSRLVSLRKIYIISDAPSPIPPGNLCREFLSEYGAPSTPLLLVAASESSHTATSAITSTATTLGELYPHPPILRGVPHAETIQRATELVATAGGAPFGPQSDMACSWPVGKDLCGELYERVLSLATGAAGTADMGSAAVDVGGLTDDGGIHPIRLAAGAIYADGRIVATTQKKALEYGCTSDAVVQLMPFLLGTHGSLVDKFSSATEGGGGKPVLLMQVDQCGLLHAPAAPARAVLAEHGSGSLCVAVHAEQETGEVDVVCTTVADLAPALPTQMLEMGGSGTGCA